MTEGDFAALVLDRRLPDGDGLDLVRQLRARGSAVPIILLTALGSIEDRAGGLDAGADDYLTKPFASTELLARLRGCPRNLEDRCPGRRRRQGRPTRYPSPRTVVTMSRSVLRRRSRCTCSRSTRTRRCRGRILREVFPPGDVPGTVDTYLHSLQLGVLAAATRRTLAGLERALPVGASPDARAGTGSRTGHGRAAHHRRPARGRLREESGAVHLHAPRGMGPLRLRGGARPGNHHPTIDGQAHLGRRLEERLRELYPRLTGSA